jgi:hypothetical protein
LGDSHFLHISNASRNGKESLARGSKMSEKKEKEKEKKDISINLSTIDHELSEALKIQTEVMLSPLVQAALKTARIFDSFNHMTESLQYMESVNRIIKDSKMIFTSFEYSMESLKAMFEYGAGTKKLLEQFSGINRILDSVKIPEIAIPRLETELAAIPPQNDILIRSLLREIDLLEKQLAKEKIKNKALIAILDEKRKELKKQYVT